ncbi:alpha/beta fold hydrolase [Microbacterium sp. cx-55]|uniref:alpha/beta hydrolase n=1 Tax=Microbacterium sp. cx-55 TaxID=2875948 RepID=UPI001CBC4401|nr:alpha/beta hydrolase [Microbacterium sp. cx-55]MBZ4486047.1 alpha/beta fold hydrolase [Microbacterium sp. cx-55]UGB34081.1 alpha/beta fold hydrolase [Microbacterium sp. cx-55]
MSERMVRVPVPGGELAVAVHDPEGAPTGAVLLVHGITASHRAWDFVLPELADMRLVAPDLRGRGQSRNVGEGAGFSAHADDLVAVLDALGVEQALVVGHSMGAFVAVVLAHRHPARVARLLLVDGGLPLDVPLGGDPDAVMAGVLGPTAARLSMRFASVEDYLGFWRQHPAFPPPWPAGLAQYFVADLVDDGAGMLRPATRYETAAADTADMIAGTALPSALAALQHPTRLITVGRGLQNEPPGLYARDYLEGVLVQHPSIRHDRIDELNHYTVVMSPQGARLVAEAVRAELSAD